MSFNRWLEGVETYSTRLERLHATFAHYDKNDWNALMRWLDAAYEVGYHDGKLDKEVPF